MNYLHPFLRIQNTQQKGKGVYTLQDIAPNTLLEISPVIVLSKKDTQLIHQTKLHDYYFSWGEEQKESAIALGYISIYNHATKANSRHECDFTNNTISIYTNKEIKAGTEICIDYNMGLKKDLWFKIQ